MDPPRDPREDHRAAVQRHDLPPHHRRLHDPGRRPARSGLRRPGLPVRRRVPPGTRVRPPVPARHGQRRPGYQRLPVLHHRRAHPAPQPEAHDLRRGGRPGRPGRRRRDRQDADRSQRQAGGRRRDRVRRGAAQLTEHQPAPPTTTCYRHPDRPTGISCARCGRPICPECMIPASVGFQCPECVREGNASVRAVKRGNGLRVAGRRWGVVTLSIIAINVAMFVATAVAAATEGFSPLDNNFSTLFARLDQFPLAVAAGEWWRPLTAAFLHIGPVHLALNMLAVLVFGSELERQLGRSRFLALYVLSALGGAASIQLFGNPQQPVAGASTAIYGLLGALGVLMVVRRQDLRGLLTLLAINVAISFLPGVSLLGHLGGLVAGAVAAGVLVATRRRPGLQIAALALLGAVLLVLIFSAPTLVTGNL